MRKRFLSWSMVLATCASAHGAEFTLYATTVPAVSPWQNASQAQGGPVADCNSGNFASIVSGNTTFLTATAFGTFTLPPGQEITRVEVDAHGRLNSGTNTNRIRIQVSGPAIATTEKNSVSWTQSDSNCDWRMEPGTNGWDITTLNPTGWTAANINSLDVAVRYRSSSMVGGSNFLRISSIRIIVTTACTADFDIDGACDGFDNCPATPNANQANSDSDTLGDACDNCDLVSNQNQADADGDTVGDACDNCQVVSNSSQSNADGDAFGDVCDSSTSVTIYAATIADDPVWQLEPQAQGGPTADCNASPPNQNYAYNEVGSNGGNTNFMTATALGAYVLPAGNTITKVEVDAHARYNLNTTNRIRMRVSGSVASTEQPSAFWNQSDTNCGWRMGLSPNGWDITNLRSSWTLTDISGLDVAVRHSSSTGSGATSNNLLRITSLRIVVTSSCCPNDSDGDGVVDAVDNCPTVQNGPLAGPNNQLDNDNDGIGDVCDQSTTRSQYAVTASAGQDWQDVVQATGGPTTDCNNNNFAFNPIGSNGGSTAYLTSLFSGYTIPAGTITRVEVDVHGRYNAGTTGNRVRMQVGGPFFPPAEQASASWNQSDTNCGWRMGLSPNGWDITSLRGSWSAADINALQVAVRHQSSSGGTSSNQLRVSSIRIVVTTNCCSAPFTIAVPAGQQTWSNPVIWSIGAEPVSSAPVINGANTFVQLDVNASVQSLTIRPQDAFPQPGALQLDALDPQIGNLTVIGGASTSNGVLPTDGVLRNDGVLTVGAGHSITANGAVALSGTQRILLAGSTAELASANASSSMTNLVPIEGRGIISAALINGSVGVVRANDPAGVIDVRGTLAKVNEGAFVADNGGTLRISNTTVTGGGTYQTSGISNPGVQSILQLAAGSPSTWVSGSTLGVYDGGLCLIDGASYFEASGDVVVAYCQPMPFMGPPGGSGIPSPDDDLPIPHGCTPPVLRVRDTSQLHVGTNCTFDGPVVTQFSASSIVTVGGNWVNHATDSVMFDSVLCNLTMDGQVPQNFELAGRDVGPPLSATVDGFVNNFAMNTVRIAAGRSVTFSDGFDNNTAFPGCEVLYVRNLIIESGATLNLQGCRIYYETLTRQAGATIVLTNGGAVVSANAGDLNGDHVVDASDMATFVSILLGGTCNAACLAAADVNGDGIINGVDIAILVQAVTAP